VIRDIGRRIAGDDALEEIFARELSLARRVLAQDRHQRGRKVYSLHAPEVECIGKGKACVSRGWDADCGDDCEDPPGIFCTGQVDQGDLS
jgi:hypothetical protein